MLYHLDSLIAFVSVILLASLIVTAATQIVIALLNLRGRNLLWGLKRLIVQIEPSLGKKADAIVKKILRNPLISSGRLPAVIRREEFSHLLVKLAESEDAEKFGEEAVKGLKTLTAVNQEELNKVKNQYSALPADWRALVEAEIKKANAYVFDRIKAARLKIMELEAWFDRFSDRMSQQFSRNSKIISVCGAVLVVVLFRLDSLQLLKRVYSDQELRARLVANVVQIQEMGDAVLGGPSIYDMGLQYLKENNADLSLPTQSFLTRESAEAWLKANLPQGLAEDEALKLYQSALTRAFNEKYGNLGSQLKKMNDTLAQLSMEIFGTWNTEKFISWEILPGYLISIILLSLGAPFWFNMLKSLTNLRTRLMESEEKERLKRQEAK